MHRPVGVSVLNAPSDDTLALVLETAILFVERLALTLLVPSPLSVCFRSERGITCGQDTCGKPLDTAWVRQHGLPV